MSLLRVVGSSVLAALFGAQAQAQAPDPDADAETIPHVRITRESGKFVALDVGSTTYGPADGDGPTVTLVGAVHIGDRAYYRAAQARLDAHDIVLYESVKPAGAGGTGGDTPAERRASTGAALEFLSDLVDRYRSEHGALPEDIDMLRKDCVTLDPRLGQFVDAARVDAWGNPVRLIWDVDPTGAAGDGGALNVGGFRVISFGADGKAGGKGEDADLSHTKAASTLAGAEQGDRIQAELAHALGLQFQLDAIDYGANNWVCSDMSADQVQREMAKRGLDFEILDGTLQGTSFPARVAQLLLRTVRIADAFTGGAIADTIKVVMIEMLGDEDVVQASLGQLDDGFVDVIIVERNTAVMDDLERVLADAKPGESIAVFYGAGHMPDLDVQLRERFAYVPRATVWDRAIEVDLERSAVTDRDVVMIRATVARMIRQMRQMRQ